MLKYKIINLKNNIRKLSIKRQSKKELHEYWKNPKDSPEKYLSGEARSDFLVNLCIKYVRPNSSVMELGCNIGRNLNHLHNAGFNELSGIEINANAIDMLRLCYPNLINADIINAPIEDVIVDLPDGSIDLVFTMAVLEHIHPESSFIFREISRITKKCLITIEDEEVYSWNHFPRDYGKIFSSCGLDQITEIRCTNIEGLGKNFVARVFFPVTYDISADVCDTSLVINKYHQIVALS